MTVFDVISLMGGLALFLYGMSILGEGLENASGGKLELVLEKLTNNIVAAVLLGAVTTAAIQSSSATTVIVVGLVNARVLTLRRAIGVIMGANIGTTVTGQILRLSDINADSFALMLLKPTTLAPLAAIVGIVFYLGSRRSNRRSLGAILLGFCVLFTGMFAMEHAVRPLRDLPQFGELFVTLSNPLLGVLAGAVVTAIIQSSSASVGILQALSSTGQITYAAAFPIIMGQNIGTCITPILAAIGASKNARRAAVVHLVFNVLGTILFLIGTYIYQHNIGFPFWNEVITRGGIADFHTLFNVACTIMFMPFAGAIERLVKAIVRDSRSDMRGERDVVLERRLLGSPALALDQGRRAMARLSEMTRVMLRLSIALFEHFHFKRVERVKEMQTSVDKLLVKVEDYILKISRRSMTKMDSLMASELLNMTIEMRHSMGDIVSIAEHAVETYDSRQHFSDSAKSELAHISRAVSECLRMTARSLVPNSYECFPEILALNTVIGQLADLLKERHIERLRQGLCSVDSSFGFVAVLADLRKVSEHCANIAVMQQVMLHGESKKSRRSIQYALREGTIRGYADSVAAFQLKYQATLAPSATVEQEQGSLLADA